MNKYLRLLRGSQKRISTRVLLRVSREFFTVFDSKFYRSSPGIFSKLFPRIHYLTIGQMAGRFPNQFFNTSEYQSGFPISDYRKKMPLLHYLIFSNGTNPLTNWDFQYLNYAPEVRMYTRAILLHFMLHGNPDFKFDSEFLHDEIEPSNQVLLIESVTGDLKVVHQENNRRVIISSCSRTIILPAINNEGLDLHQIYFEKAHHAFEKGICSQLIDIKLNHNQDIEIFSHSPLLLEVGQLTKFLDEWDSRIFGEEESAIGNYRTYLRNKSKYLQRVVNFDSWNAESFQLIPGDFLMHHASPQKNARTSIRQRTHHEKTTSKILLISHEDSRTGAPIYLLQVARSLVSKGFEVQIISLRDDIKSEVFGEFGIAHSYLSDHLSGEEKKRSTPLMNWLITTAGDTAMSRILRLFKPDIIIVNSLAASDAIRVAHLYKIPVALYVHEAWKFELPNWSTADTFKSRVRDALQAASVVWFGSEATRSHWESSGFAINAMTIPSYRDVSVPISNKRNQLRQDMRDELGFTGDQRILLSVATFEPRKRIEDIIKAYLQHDDVRLGLILIGGTPGFLNHELRELVKGRDDIKILGPQKDLDAYYASADCLILASEEETMPLVLQEAALWEIPRIVAMFSGYQELVPSQAHGFLFKPKDWRGLSEAIEKFLSSGNVELFEMKKKAKEFQEKKSKSGIVQITRSIEQVSKNRWALVPEGWLNENC